jgi:acetyl esterase
MIRPTRSAPAGAVTPDRWTLIYDGQCGLCGRMVRRLEGLDRNDRLDLVAYQDRSDDSGWDWIPGDALEEAMHLVSPDGEAWAGAAAVERVLPLLPGGRSPSLLFRLPLVRAVAGRVYRWVAEHRGRLGCGEHCPRA